MLHKLRSVLTMLGIIFGVCSVIAMLAIGEGASYEAQQAIKKLGSQNIIIRSVKPTDDARKAGLSRGFGLEYGLTYDDASRIQSTIPGVVRVLPVRIIRENVRFFRSNVPCQIIGTLPFYRKSLALTSSGRFLPKPTKSTDNVCVLTAGLASDCFPIKTPGRSIRSTRPTGSSAWCGKNMPEQRTQAGKMEEPSTITLYRSKRCALAV
jgi:putative ABC transport system permease protein